jgi:hypothetical protein
MIKTLTVHDFHEAFRNSERRDQFSFDAQRLLFNYFEQVEEDTGEQIELDIIAICCEYTEENVRDVAEYYNIDIKNIAEDDILQAVLDFIQEATSVVGVTVDKKIVYLTC